MRVCTLAARTPKHFRKLWCVRRTRHFGVTPNFIGKIRNKPENQSYTETTAYYSVYLLVIFTQGPYLKLVSIFFKWLSEPPAYIVGTIFSIHVVVKYNTYIVYVTRGI